jgi:hypothetical protein
VESIVALLGAVRRVVAVEHDLAPELLASGAELRALAEWHLADTPSTKPEVDVFTSWREALVGGPILDTLSGKVSIRVAASSPSGLELTRM